MNNENQFEDVNEVLDNSTATLPKLNTSNNVSDEIDLPKLDEIKTIGNVKKDKQKSPINMIILFLALILVIFFLPQITPYFSTILSYLNISDNNSIYGNEEKNPETPSKEEETPIEEKYYSFLDQAEVIYENLTFSDISKSAEDILYLNYKIKNTGKELFDFNKTKIYFDFYNDNNTYLGRSLITTNKLNAGSEITLKSPINEEIFNQASKYTIVLRTSDDYPLLTLNSNNLICTFKTKKYVYTFKDNLLNNIHYEFEYQKTDEEKYPSDYIKYKTELDQMNLVNGVSTALIDTSTGFIASVTFDYNIVATDMTVYDILFYSKDEEAKTINYEMESRGYSCN